MRKIISAISAHKREKSKKVVFYPEERAAIPAPKENTNIEGNYSPPNYSIRISSIREAENTKCSNKESIQEKKAHAAICSGLTADQVLLLSYAKSYEIKNPYFQEFWRYKYSLSGSELRENLQILLRHGYIAPQSMEEWLCSLTVKELKEQLDRYGINVNGKKDVLITALIGRVDEQEIYKIARARKYTITPAGQEIIDSYPYIRYVHAHQAAGYDIWSIADDVYEQKPKNWRDLILRKYNENLQSAAKKEDLTSLRNNYMGMGDFLVEENKLNGALDVYCQVARIDICSAEKWRSAAEILDDNNAIVPWVKERIKTLLRELDIPEDQQQARIVEALRMNSKYFVTDEIARCML